MEQSEVKTPPQLEKLFRYALEITPPNERELFDWYFKLIAREAYRLDDLPPAAHAIIVMFVRAASAAELERIKTDVQSGKRAGELEAVLSVEQFFEEAVMPELNDYFERLNELKDAVLEADELFIDEDDERAERNQ